MHILGGNVHDDYGLTAILENAEDSLTVIVDRQDMDVYYQMHVNKSGETVVIDRNGYEIFKITALMGAP